MVYLETEFRLKDIIREEFKILKKQNNPDLIYKSDFFKYGCDFFPMVFEEKTSIDYPLYLRAKRRWIRDWGHDRKNNEKGFLNLKVDYEVDFNGI